jgi:aryl-alcohol dehydrogenase-like predicted oxidoreductase
MSRRAFGPTRVNVPIIGLGTWQMEQDDEASAVLALRAGLDLGLLHVDTAELYGDGRAEELVAKAIAGRRDDGRLHALREKHLSARTRPADARVAML